MEPNESAWGMHINSSDHNSRMPPVPALFSIKGQNAWKWRGVVVWRREPEQVVCMQPGDAMKTIKELKQSKELQSEGYTIGEWGISFEVDLKTKVSKSSEPGLLNPMHLSPDQTVELLKFLQSQLDIIREMCEEDQIRYESGMKIIA